MIRQRYAMASGSERFSQGNLGYSLTNGQPVLDQIVESSGTRPFC